MSQKQTNSITISDKAYNLLVNQGRTVLWKTPRKPDYEVAHRLELYAVYKVKGSGSKSCLATVTAISNSMAFMIKGDHRKEFTSRQPADDNIRYIITAIRYDGLRHMAMANNALNTYETKELAENMLQAILKENNPAKIEELMGKDLRVDAVPCYPSGDAKRTII